MASKIILKKSSIANKIPIVSDLDFGELAINYLDSKLYFKKADGISIGSFSVPAEVTYPILLDDVSAQTDSEKSVFNLRESAVPLSTTKIVSSRDLTVTVNGKYLQPYVTDADYVFMPVHIDCKGFRVRENRLVIYSAPEVGSQISIVLQTIPTKQNPRRYPFSASNIGLGD
tara:strand:+ start:11908 stop:12423 length:516 start_codon:yes stop_codon:yes gene_type:complete